MWTKTTTTTAAMARQQGDDDDDVQDVRQHIFVSHVCVSVCERCAYNEGSKSIHTNNCARSRSHIHTHRRNSRNNNTHYAHAVHIHVAHITWSV